MKVICISDTEIIKHDNPYIEPKEYKWRVLKVGETYTIMSAHDRGNGKITFYIEELYQFIPGELFISLQQLREQKLNELGI
jgi:hypothetical protein